MPLSAFDLPSPIILLLLLSSTLRQEVGAMSSVNKLVNLGSKSLVNKYFALRHGNSMANQMQIISSDPAISTVQHGLSDLGHQQAKSSAIEFVDRYKNNENNEKIYTAGVAIFSSDFTRARETAEHMANACQNADIPLFISEKSTESDVVTSPLCNVNIRKSLRERFFGEFNGENDDNYQNVWNEDVNSADHTRWGVESVNSVLHRTTSLILDIETELLVPNKHQQWVCLLVAHGDVLQILQTGFCKLDGMKHRTMPHLDTATVRQLELAE